MSKNVDVIDLFDEEVNKKDKRLERKIERARLKEEKKEAKRKRKLEKQEEDGFDKYLEKIKEEKVIEEAVEIKPKVEDVIKQPFIPDVPVPVKTKPEVDMDNDLTRKITTISEIKEFHPVKKHPILNFFVVLFSIILIVISGDYLLYNTYTNYTDLKTMIISIILVSTVIFYLLSIITKKEGPKKFFQIISLILFSCYMGYYLFII